MIKIKRILKDYEDAGALNAVVNLHAAISENVFLTKSGDLVMLLALKGADSECWEHGAIDHTARRFESTLRIFDEHFRLYQYLLKSDNALIPREHYADSVVEQAIGNRMEYLNAKAETLYSLETYMAVVYESWMPEEDLRRRLMNLVTDLKPTLGRMLSTASAGAKLADDMERAREILVSKVSSFVLQLRDVVQVEILDIQRGYTLLRRLLNYASFKTDGIRLADPRFVDFQACDSALECHRDHLRLDDYYVQALTLKVPSVRTFAHALSGLASLPCTFIAAQEWRRENPLAVRKLIQSKRRHFHNAKTSLMNYVHTNSQTPVHDMLVDDGAVALVANLGGCLEEMEVRGRSFGHFSLTVILYSQDWSTLRRSVAECFKVFAANGAQLTEERYNLLNAWLAVLPGNSSYNLRRLWLTDSNCADLSFLFTPDTGQVRNEQLGVEYLAVLETAGATPYFFNLHDKDVAHTLVLGATGSGKSFLLNFLLTHLQKYKPFTFIFDLGGSYASLTHLFGGSYLRVVGQDRAFTINPFCLTPTAENLQFLFAFVKVLVESGTYRMSAQDDRDLYEQIENLYEIGADQRRLLTLSNIVNRSLRAQLAKWVLGGPYAALFDNTDDNLTLSPFQTFDFEGAERVPEQMEPLLFYILHRASAVIQEVAQEMRFKAFVIEEAWRFFRHPTIKSYILEALKTWRKKNAAMILATQSSEDLLASDLLPVVIESCPTQLFLANPGMDRDAYQRTFHLNDAEIEAIAGLVPKQEFLLKRPNMAKRLALRVDRKGYWLYTNNPQDNHLRREAFERHGFTEGLEILARRTS